MKRNNLLATASFVAVAGAVSAYFLLTKKRKNKFPELKTDTVDLDRYLGKWYDIAHLPAIFQKGCFNTKAIYSLNEDGSIKVVNTCNKDSIHGREIIAEGVATVVDKKNKSKLKVAFLWPFKGDYWILKVGENYEYALVGEPSRQYLWILSRTPHMGEDVLKQLIDLANEAGFGTNNLIMTRHALQEQY